MGRGLIGLALALSCFASGSRFPAKAEEGFIRNINVSLADSGYLLDLSLAKRDLSETGRLAFFIGESRFALFDTYGRERFMASLSRKTGLLDFCGLKTLRLEYRTDAEIREEKCYLRGFKGSEEHSDGLSFLYAYCVRGDDIILGESVRIDIQETFFLPLGASFYPSRLAAVFYTPSAENYIRFSLLIGDMTFPLALHGGSEACESYLSYEGKIRIDEEPADCRLEMDYLRLKGEKVIFSLDIPSRQVMATEEEPGYYLDFEEYEL